MTRSLVGVLFLAALCVSFAPQKAPSSGSSLVTLYAHDDLLSSFSFETGEFGARIVDGELILDDTQIALVAYCRDCR